MITVIYHGNCADGFGAMLACYDFFGDEAEYIPAKYGEDPVDRTGDDLIFVDFCYPRDIMQRLGRTNESVLVLDHHKTAEEALADVPRFSDLESWNASSTSYGALFDMDRSGAGIAWDFFHSGRPKLVDHIEDRDLWRFELEGTREIQQALFSYRYDRDLWRQLFLRFEEECAAYGPTGTSLYTEGRALVRKHTKDIDELLNVCRTEAFIGGYLVPVANLPYTMASDAAGQMAEGRDFAAAYFIDGDRQVNVSLRSRGDGIDVSEIAKQFGGGGHRGASGFRMPLADWINILNFKGE